MQPSHGTFILLCLLLVGSASAELVAVSQMGYHPSAAKQAVSYTSVASGTFTVRDASTNAIVFSGSLTKARDYDNTMNAECQGNNPCLVADFSGFRTAGTYYVQTSLGGRSPNFVINTNVFSTNMPVMQEFFNAQLQQSSAYHGDMHASANPDFTIIADGSFLMEADQAALTLMRLGSAYRRNPQLFQTDKYTMLAPGKPDMQEHIKIYADYLAGLQGIAIENRTDGTGFRLSQFVKIDNAFTPGAVTQSSITVYDGGHNPIATYPVQSLCGPSDGSAAYNACISNAATFYKCQVGEICLNMSYIDKTGTLASNKQGFDVSKGWSYEFGCYPDIPLTGVFNEQMNPCLVFHPESNAQYTIQTLLAYLEALPAVNAYSASDGQKLFERALYTQQYIKNNYAVTGSDNTGFYGAALFLLYDYTGNTQFLRDAHALRSSVDVTFIGDKTHGNEFYWEEYARHKSDILVLGLQYQYNAADPENFFRGKIFNDYKDQGERSISRNAERVFIFDNNVQFSNSRFILTEGLLASKATELFTGAESFIPMVADNQLAWITGMNGVQDGISVSGSPIASYSFIFGIGNHPDEFHSRFLLDTGYRSASGGSVVGARSTGFFFQTGSGWSEFDGVATILGQKLGALGNQYNGEAYNDPFKPKTFTNGKTFIPGWINGAFDVLHDNDVIYNYRDDRDTWEMTETTNEQAATAIELFAYLDGRYNSKPRAAAPRFTLPGAYATLTVQSNSDPVISLNGEANGKASATYTVAPGTYTISATKTGFSTNSTTVTLAAGETRTASLNVYSSNAVITVSSSPAGALTVDGINKGTTPQTVVVAPGTHSVSVSAGGYGTNSTTVTLAERESRSVSLQLYTVVPNATACYNSVQNMPASCTGGSVTSDTYDGCRHVTCVGSSGSITIMGCDKGTKVEVYRQSATGTVPKVCLASVCVQSNGFESANFPVCVNSNNTCTPSTETCNAKDDDCDGQVDEGSVCAPTCTPSAETCDSVDNDCDGQIDEGSVCSSTCYNSVKDIPATCTGATITADTYDGCRRITCGGMQALACDKSGFFEMYKIGGSGVKICLDGACVSDSSGYAKSSNFPVCTGTSTCTPTTEICDGADNDCDSQIDENNVCAPTCTPATETCNAKDDDCDGQVDENNVCSSNTCYNSVKTIPVTCSTGSVTQDTWNGCRIVTCASGTNSLQVQACDKAGFFEIYRKAATGTAPKVCFLSTCMQNEGYVKSNSFPVCTSGSTCTPTTETCDTKDNDCDGQVDEGGVCTPTCTPSTETCNSKDDDCDGQIDEGGACDVTASSVSVAVGQWYPKGREYLFNCNAQGFTPTTYGWNFGDGTSWPRANKDQYYTYSAAGSYTVTCTASDGATTKSGSLSVTVA